MHDRIRKARKHAKLSQAALGEAVGVVQSAVVSWEKEGGNEPDLDRLAKIAEKTGVRREWLTNGTGEMQRDNGSAEKSLAFENQNENIRPETTRDTSVKSLHDLPEDLVRPGKKNLPILGHAKGGEEGFFMDQGRIHGYTERPGILEGVTDAYAVRVHDESMHPVLKHGFLVWVDPHRPAAPGDEVVIQLKDGQAFIKTLVRRTAAKIKCKQYNPERDVDYPSDGSTLHLIVGSTRIRG